MRTGILAPLLLVASLAGTAVFAWSKEDHEIFRLRDEVELYEGEGVTFYDFLGVKSGISASQDDLNKAYKKTSVRLHPDKHKPKPLPGSTKPLSKTQLRDSQKQASERFARLGLVAAILRGPGRERYDHFVRNGFPRWRGTGYYYARFRPGLFTVLAALFVFVGGVGHYVILYLTSRQQKQLMQRYIREARTAAWGSSGIPGVSAAALAAGGAESDTAAEQEPKKNRAERRAKKPKEKPTTSRSTTPVVVPTVKKRVVSDNGKVFIVDGLGNVFLLGENEDGGQEEYMLDVDEIEGPKWRNTYLVRLPMALLKASFGKLLPSKYAGGSEEEEEEQEEEEEEEGEVVNGENGKKIATAAGRKKGAPKKVESRGDGLPRRKVNARAAKKQK